MPIEFKIDNAAGIVYTTISSAVSIDEIVAGLTGIINHADFRPGLNGLTDVRQSQLASSSNDVRRLADLMIANRDRIGPSRTAIVVSDDVTFGMARMFQAFSERSMTETKIFKDIDEARRWLKE